MNEEMSALPSAPYFVCSGDKRYFELVEMVETSVMATQLALLDDRDSQNTAYDSEGVTWSFTWERPKMDRGFLSKLIAQVHNPARKVNVLWKRGRTYAFDALRTNYQKAINQDDDILTQFVEEEELLKRVADCRDFSSLVEVWNWASVDHFDEEEED